MDIVNNIIKFEGGELTHEEIIEFFKELYLSNALFGLQGFYQRTFKDLCENNLINLKELNTLKRI